MFQPVRVVEVVVVASFRMMHHLFLRLGDLAAVRPLVGFRITRELPDLRFL